MIDKKVHPKVQLIYNLFMFSLVASLMYMQVLVQIQTLHVYAFSCSHAKVTYHTSFVKKTRGFESKAQNFACCSLVSM